MRKAKEKIGFSEKADMEFNKTEKALLKVAANVISKTKKNNSHLVVASKGGKVKKISAKDL